MNTKKGKKYSNLIYFIIIILLILYLVLSNIKISSSQDEILFLKFLKIGKKQEDLLENEKYMQTNNKNNNIVKYKFNITYKNLKFKNVNLAETINEDTLTYEKIAPGVNGEFEIIIDSNKTMNYKVNFNSINEKPKNLKFSFEEGNIKTDSLEELSKYLAGTILKNTTKVVKIAWVWEYENTKEANIQDTKDAKNIENYNFNINVKGEEKT